MTRRRSGGFGGPAQSGLNQSAMMRQIQKMQEEMEAAQAALADEMVEVSVGGGAVKVTVNGQSQLQAIVIDKDAIDTTDAEWATDLQDLLVAAINQAMEQAQTLASERMNRFTGGLQSMLPPGLLGM